MVATFARETSLSFCAVTFSPLFIGAMVATFKTLGTAYTMQPFSPLFIGAMVATCQYDTKIVTENTFSPLFIGAMVATSTGRLTGWVAPVFQSPFHRGNGCYFDRTPNRLGRPGLSVPFSSGQWLLLCWGVGTRY